MPTDPVDQLRAIGDSFDELVPPVTMADLTGRPSNARRGRIVVKAFAAAAAVVTVVGVGAIALSRRSDEAVPEDSAPPTTVVADPEIAAALAAWGESGPSNYNLKVATTSPHGLITVECEFRVDGSTGDLIRGPIRSAPIDSVLQLPDLRACSTQPSTVEGLLNLILQHRSEGHDVPVTFDERGVPIKFTLDADQAAVDGSQWVQVTVSEPLALTAVALSAGDHLVCGPAGGNGVNVSVTSDLVGLTARIVIDDRVLANSEPTPAAGTVGVFFDASSVPSDVPDPSGKIGELQILDGDGYVLASQPFTWATASSEPCY